MAGKKPAKPMAGQNKTVHQDPSIYGVCVKYFGFPDAPSICKICGKRTIKGMIRMKGEATFCCAGCSHRHHVLQTQESTDISI